MLNHLLTTVAFLPSNFAEKSNQFTRRKTKTEIDKYGKQKSLVIFPLILQI